MNMIVKSAAVAVAAPAVALADHSATAVPSVVPPALPTGPTKIERLWEERAALKRQYKDLHKALRNLDAEFARRMPAPHPSIVYSPESAADGLVPISPRLRENYIWPLYIEGALSRLKYRYDRPVTQDVVEAIKKAGGPAPLNDRRRHFGIG